MNPWFGRGPAASGIDPDDAPWPPAFGVRGPDRRPRRRSATPPLSIGEGRSRESQA